MNETIHQPLDGITPSEQFIEHMGPYLRRNFPHDSFELWIIEQDDSFLFNRAWLGNVGIASIQQQNRQHRYEELMAQQAKAKNNENLTISVPPPPRCIILHDVDLIPTVDGVPYTNCTRPIQLGSELAHFNNSIPYPLYTGGVGPSMTLEHWTKINGMSNDFYGTYQNIRRDVTVEFISSFLHPNIYFLTKYFYGCIHSTYCTQQAGVERMTNCGIDFV